jgi:hypothetical protein
LSWASPAAADHCGALSDCFATARAAIAALVGVAVFVGLIALAPEILPELFFAKGAIEAVTGRDLLTGDELAAWQRVLGVIPFEGAVEEEAATGARLAAEEEQAAAEGAELAQLEGRSSVGASRRLDYEPSPKHGPIPRGRVGAAPVNGQAALDVSLQVGPNSPRRISIDYEAGDFVVFDQTSAGIFHGHVREWKDLTQPMKNALRRAGIVNARGRIL